jgi:Myb-like DNA-binding domain
MLPKPGIQCKLSVHSTEDQDQLNPSRWSAIAEHIPGRTNKDCRKRWFVKMAQDVVKGSWAPDEDQRLLKGVAQYGTR